MAYAYHGNYCGPGWSAGKYQPSVVSDVAAVDEFDLSCKNHDAAYAVGADRTSADLDFAYHNITSMDAKRVVAGVLVGMQGFGRLVIPGFDKPDNSLSNSLPNTPNLANTNYLFQMKQSKQSRSSAPTARKSKQQQRPTTSINTAPVSIGTTLRATKPIISQQRSGICVRNREFLCSVFESNNSNWYLGAAAPLNPAYYPGSVMGQMARGWSKYRFRSITIHFVTRQPTSVTGEIALVYSGDLFLPAENGASGSFLNRVMTRGDAIIGPLWINHSMDVVCDDVWRMIDCFGSAPFNDNILGEIQAYTLSGVSDTAGYLLIDYELCFSDTMYSPHNNVLPLASGPGQQLTLTDTSTTPTANNAVLLTNSTILNSAGLGCIWRCILNLDESTLATGTAANNAWNLQYVYGSNTSADGNTLEAYTHGDGNVFYTGKASGSVLTVYCSYEGAVSGNASAQFFYKTTGSTAASWNVVAYLVRTSNLEISTPY